jgi:hypothetical protein
MHAEPSMAEKGGFSPDCVAAFREALSNRELSSDLTDH